MTTDLEVLDSFVDGESVAPDDLKRALADPAGRDYFVHIWALRAIAKDDRRDVATPVPQPSVPAVHARRVPPWLAAAALVVCATGGFVLGQRVPPTVSVAPAPVPATAVASPTTSPAPANSVFSAPAPTRVIQLEFQPVPAANGGH